jgi:benzodiazapine receptor
VEDHRPTARPAARHSGSGQVVGLLGWLLLTFAAAAVGAVASAEAGAFYAQLVRPSWAPPGWLFAPVWTVLYVLMGVAAWLVWREHGFKEGRTALALFIVQLGANALWTWVFFVWHRGALAFAEIMLLWCLIVATAASFRRLNALAAALLLPYLAWVTFACALTFSTWRLNPGVL